MTGVRILIFEPEATGHQMEVLRYLLNAIGRQLADPSVVLLTTQEAATHPNCIRLLEDFSAVVRVHVLRPFNERNRFFHAISAFYERQWQNAEQFSRGFNEIGPDNIDFVILPHLESIGLLHLGLRPSLFRGKPWATIAIGIRFHHRQAGVEGPSQWQDIVQRLFFWRVIAHPMLVCLGSVNPYLARVANHPKVAWCPEPAEAPRLTPSEVARKAYGIRPETCVVLVFGFIDRRKCVDVLLEGMALLDPDLDVTVFLAGTQHAGHLAPVLASPAARQLKARGRLIEANRYIMVGRDIDPMSVADMTWVFYEKNFVYTGSVLVRSALSRRAVICRGQGVIGRLVAESECGLVLTSGAPEIVAAAITRLAKDPAARAAMGERGANAFVKNTPEAFARPIVDSVARAVVAR